jgi:hypothetical protein
MPVREVSVMARRFMISSFVVFRRGAMMLGRLLVMLGCLAMMVYSVFRHGFTPFYRRFFTGLNAARLDHTRRLWR